MRILLDMDEVLCDFVGGALRAHGWTRKRLEAVWTAGEYSIVEPMGLSLDAFARPILQLGEQFWCDLQPTPWMSQLLEGVTGLTDDWYIVTSPFLPDDGVACYSGKLQWVKWHLGTPDRLLITRHKHLLAKPGVALVDDRASNVERFVAEGGRGVLFPSRHNPCHAMAQQCCSYTLEMLSIIQQKEDHPCT